MKFSTITGIPRDDYQHVPEHIRIDRLTTDTAVKNSHIQKRRQGPNQYYLYLDRTCIMAGTSKDLAEELEVLPSVVTDYARNGKTLKKEYKILPV